jgi:hypothetical protein
MSNDTAIAPVDRYRIQHARGPSAVHTSVLTCPVLVAFLLILHGVALETNVYGKQAFTAGTFSYSTPTTSDGNYPEAIYFEKVNTVNSVGPNGERILDALGGDYGASALTLYNLATLGSDANYIDFWNGGDGIYLEIDAKFSSVAEADLVSLAAIMSMGNRRASPESFRKNFGLDLNFTSGELEITTHGDGTVGFGSYTADDNWYTLRVYLLPSSDNGTTGDGIIRVWKKLSTASAASFTLEYEDTTSFLWSSPFVGAPLNGQNYVNIGRYGILPSTNFRIFIVTDDTQAYIFGKDADVSSNLTFVINVDGVDRTSSGAGPIDEPGTVYIGGDLIVTGTISGTLTSGSAALDDLSDVTITTPAANHVLSYNGSAWVNTAAPQIARVGIGVAADANVKLKVSGQMGSVLNDAGNSSTAITVNWHNGNTQLVTLTGAATITLTNPQDGFEYVLALKQDGTGSRVPTLPASVKFSGGVTPTWSTAAGKVDVVRMRWFAGLGASGNYLAQAVTDYTPA